MSDIPKDQLTLTKLVLANAGLDDAAIRETLRLDPQLPYTNEMKTAASNIRKQLQSEAAARIVAEYEASPEGRAEAALKAREDALRRGQLIEGARVMLGDDAEGLTDAEVLDAAGIDQTGPISQARLAREEDERLANDYDANVAAAWGDSEEGNDQ